MISLKINFKWKNFYKIKCRNKNRESKSKTLKIDKVSHTPVLHTRH
jgi:hypothetical protein